MLSVSCSYSIGLDATALMQSRFWLGISSKANWTGRPVVQYVGTSLLDGVYVLGLSHANLSCCCLHFELDKLHILKNFVRSQIMRAKYYVLPLGLSIFFVVEEVGSLGFNFCCIFK